MTLIAAPIFVREPSGVDDAISRAARAAEFGANLIEWRIDLLAMQPLDVARPAVEQLVARCPLPSILTCRPTWEGGLYEGDEQRRRDLIMAVSLADRPPRYIDLELAAIDRDDAWKEMQVAGDPTSLILSTHDFASRPENLITRVTRMSGPRSGDVIKVAWMARSLRDNLEAFDLLRERPKPMIALCMGPFGLPSRILAPKFGAFLTFAAVSEGDESAPGQPSLEEIKELYRFDSINKDTRVYGVIGWPVAHSLSPRIHNAGFTRAKFNGVYLPMPVPPEWEHFKATLGAWIDHSHLHFRGASVTLPHKEHLVRFVEERGGRLDDYARLAGAANTLLVGSAGAVVCRNTDAPAMIGCLADALNIDPARLKGMRVAVLGAGGVARAALAGLIRHDMDVTIFNRTRDNAERLADEMSDRAKQIESMSSIRVGENRMLGGERFDIYINCTSIGMVGGPDPNRTPFEVLMEPERGPDAQRAFDAVIDEDSVIFDTVYAPTWTPLIEMAELRGAQVILGVDLFLRQAALQFESWTGEYAPIDEFTRVLKARA